MYLNERMNEIFEYLKKNRSASVDELAKKLFVSKATVRRDLEAMQRLGLISRTHGGAVYYGQTSEISIYVRQRENAESKAEVARIALKHLPAFSSVFIDNSSTCLNIPDLFFFANKTVVTNGMQIATKINLQENVKLFMPGGEVHFNTNAMTGELACEALKNFRFDLMLCSCAQLDYHGCYEQAVETTAIKKAALQNSRVKILLADQSKLDLTSVYKTVDLTVFDAVITDADDMTVMRYRMNGVKMYNH